MTELANLERSPVNPARALPGKEEEEEDNGESSTDVLNVVKKSSLTEFSFFALEEAIEGRWEFTRFL